MTKSISCKDAGKDCSWSYTSETIDELMVEVLKHVKTEHKEIELNTETIKNIKNLIKDE